MASKSKLSAHDWIEHQEVTGWESVEKVLTRLARDQCAGAPLICGSMSKSAAHVLYTYRCAFFSKHGCKWQARVRVPRDESMIPVKPALRSQVHAQHQCVVEVAADTSHCNHFGQQDTGAHMVWKAAVQKEPALLDFKARQIFKWLQDHDVEGVDENMANRCKRFNERERRKAAQGRVGTDVDLHTVGGLRTQSCCLQSCSKSTPACAEFIVVRCV